MGQKEEWENEKAESITVPSTAMRVMGRNVKAEFPNLDNGQQLTGAGRAGPRVG